MNPLPFWLKGLYRDPFQESPGKLDLMGRMPPGLSAMRWLDLDFVREPPWLSVTLAALEAGFACLPDLKTAPWWPCSWHPCVCATSGKWKGCLVFREAESLLSEALAYESECLATRWLMHGMHLCAMLVQSSSLLFGWQRDYSSIAASPGTVHSQA